jgi:hypothetical protein
LTIPQAIEAAAFGEMGHFASFVVFVFASLAISALVDDAPCLGDKCAT